MIFRANFTNHVRDIHETTGWHPTSEAAQAALMRLQNVGPFQLLGRVAGDASEPGQPCLYAPRNGGAVDIDVRED